MSSLVNDADLDVAVTNVIVTLHHLTVDLEDGRTISVPLSWYPRLMHGTAAEKANFQIEPLGVSWPDLDADISIRGLILGHRSGECANSFQTWLAHRARGEKVPVATFSLPDDLAAELEEVVR